MMTKQCNECGQVKDVSEFALKTNGRPKPYCRPCVRKRNGRYKQSPKGRAANARWWQSPTGKAAKRRWHAKENLSEKQRAREAARAAKRAGQLVSRPCGDCGSTDRVQMHHEDYSKPLEVTWLCHACHNLRHGKIGAEPIIAA